MFREPKDSLRVKKNGIKRDGRGKGGMGHWEECEALALRWEASGGSQQGVS